MGSWRTGTVSSLVTQATGSRTGDGVYDVTGIGSRHGRTLSRLRRGPGHDSSIQTHPLTRVSSRTEGWGSPVMRSLGKTRSGWTHGSRTKPDVTRYDHRTSTTIYSRPSRP